MHCGVPVPSASTVCKRVTGERCVHATATSARGGEDELQCAASVATSPLRPRTEVKQAASHTLVRPTGSAPARRPTVLQKRPVVNVGNSRAEITCLWPSCSLFQGCGVVVFDPLRGLIGSAARAISYA